ncbi:putative ABC transporter substrate-binding lipoprotein YhfQ precursor [Oxobacter pfennigii]|uniref:Putative ABC transporter substrate-binding lipoprotein YhfQ n=1 Tax=Oxobacter pfennigii TaxID=36849 RepID=A0A0P8WYC6_9CLOT|nr:ABC transporter substrate-binding protein [Oxobacter pfennigii]KPU43387.1 putative ABC transporter substrate-binding lipoprotein YhfQ precursor [Oxobacter pfennigii]
MKKTLRSLPRLLFLLVILCIVLAGCGSNNKPAQSGTIGPEFIKNETESTITITDPLGNEVTLPKNPQRVVSLYASYLDLWYEAGGKAIASVSSASLPEGVEDLGSMSQISPEKILALKPDLMILTSSMESQVALKDILEENKIPYLFVKYDLYQDYIDNLELMSRLNGTQEQVDPKVKEIEDKINATIDGVKGKTAPKVLIMFTTSKAISCEVSKGTTGNMVELLGGTNIVKDIPVEGETRVDFSMESIAAGDPDMILIKTMGDVEACKALVKKELESNEAWAAMRAVKEGKVYYLDKELFLNKPNERFPEAFETLAGYLYPDK